MLKVLITGSGGFMGSNLKSVMPANRYEVVELQAPHATTIEGKVYNSVSALFARHSHFDIVFHLAAVIPYGAMNSQDNGMTKVNVELTDELTTTYPEARFVFASSVAVYGDCSDVPITAHSTPINVNAYGRSKATAESLICRLNSFAVIRFASIIGPRMKPISMVPKMIKQAQSDGCIKVYGDGRRQQNYLDVRDAVQLLMLTGETTENMIVLGVSHREYSNLQVAEIIANLTGAQLDFEGVDPSLSCHYDDRATHNRLRFKPKYELIETIRDIIAS